MALFMDVHNIDGPVAEGDVALAHKADLAKQDPAKLMTAVDAANKAKKITEKPPTEPQLADWIDQAKKLPQVVEAK